LSRRGSSEEVVAGRADELAHGAVAEPVGVEAAHDGGGDRGGLPHHELGRARHLVGQRHLGDLQLAALGIRSAPEVDDRGEAGDDRLLVVNLGRDLPLASAPEPLLAPSEDARWALAWSSADARYGGGGTAAFDADGPWRLQGHTAVVLRPAPRAP